MRLRVEEKDELGAELSPAQCEQTPTFAPADLKAARGENKKQTDDFCLFSPAGERRTTELDCFSCVYCTNSVDKIDVTILSRGNNKREQSSQTFDTRVRRMKVSRQSRVPNESSQSGTCELQRSLWSREQEGSRYVQLVSKQLVQSRTFKIVRPQRQSS